MRSQLTCLEVACQDDDTAAAAEHAWARLSGACHHHAFELAPTATEAQRLIDAVRTLEADAVSDRVTVEVGQ